MNEEGKDRISGLDERLYSRTRYRHPLDRRHDVRPTEQVEVGDKWQTPGLDEMLTRERISSNTTPVVKKVFVFSLLFFIAAIIIAGFVFVGGANFVSSRNVDISVLGPTIISAGETLELGVSVSNTNNADLEVANLSVQFPAGSRSPQNTSESLTFIQEELGAIRAGSEAVRDIQVVLLGAAGEIKEIKFSVEYKVKGSNATFYKDKIYEVTIGNAPLTLTVESPEAVISGESFYTDISVMHNSSDILKDVILKAEYPHGYSYMDSEPRLAAEGNIWILGDLAPGDKKTISIRGRILGENEEERTFRFYAGVSETNILSPSLKIPIVSVHNTIAIDRPYIGLNITFNGDNVPTYITSAARPVNVTVKYQNNLSDKLVNPRLEARITGSALDKFSVQAGETGFYDSANSRVVWSLTNSLGNSELNPGEGGQVTVRLNSLEADELPANARDISLNFSVSGTPVGAAGQRPVTVLESRTVRISSEINLASKMLYSTGPFVNNGPIPPKAETETTYTAVLNVSNTQVDLEDARVTARLGPGVTWLGSKSFNPEDVNYDEGSNIVSWNLGNFSSNSAPTASREIAFQVSITPSVSQIGTAPVLVSSIVFTGRDPVLNRTITINNQPLTTRISADPIFIQGDDIVVK